MQSTSSTPSLSIRKEPSGENRNSPAQSSIFAELTLEQLEPCSIHDFEEEIQTPRRELFPLE